MSGRVFVCVSGGVVDEVIVPPQTDGTWTVIDWDNIESQVCSQKALQIPPFLIRRGPHSSFSNSVFHPKTEICPSPRKANHDRMRS